MQPVIRVRKGNATATLDAETRKGKTEWKAEKKRLRERCVLPPRSPSTDSYNGRTHRKCGGSLDYLGGVGGGAGMVTLVGACDRCRLTIGRRYVSEAATRAANA